jgi:serine/threonine protein phosphatase PrpC
MVRAFENTDWKFKALFPEAANNCGSTAVVCVILGNKLICANVGDARAILCRNGMAVNLS